MSDENLPPSRPEPDSRPPEAVEQSEPLDQSHRLDPSGRAERSEGAAAPLDAEPTQPISGGGWTSPSESHGSDSSTARTDPGGRGASPFASSGPLPPSPPAFGPGAPMTGQMPDPASSVPGPMPSSMSSGMPAGPSYGQAPATMPMPAGPAYGQALPTMPMPVRPHDRPGGRVPAWVWPLVALLSLLLGLTGGVLGGIGYERWDGGEAASPYTTAVDNGPAPVPAPLDADNGSIAAVAQALLPSTVQIIAEFGGQDEGATGSGFVLDRAGHIVTNNHVVATAAEDDGPITVVDSEGARHKATVVGRSPVYDLAILSIEDPKGLVPASLGASTVLHVGDPLIAFGSPLGLSQTVTSGIVSALDRPVTTGDENNNSSYINAVQTDAAINPGNSGGPLVNLAGQVVGVNSAIATTGGGGIGGGAAGNIGVGFAIPIEQVRITADQILKTGEARYPIIGAEVQTGGAASTGALITKVSPGSPASKAGLRKDDVVTKVDSKLVTDGIALIVAIRTHQPGEKITFTIERDGSEQTVEVTLDGQVG